MSNSEFLERFKGLAEVYEHFGGEPGQNRARIKAFAQAAIAAAPTNAEVARERVTAREAYLATALLIKSDPKRYDALVANIENEHTRGTDAYPDTLSRACEAPMEFHMTL